MPVITRSTLSRRIREMISNGRYSREGHDSTRQPCFFNSPDTSNKPRNAMTEDQRENLRKLIREIPLDSAFLHFYDIFCTEIADSTSEFYYNRHWTFMSLYRVMEQLKHYKNKGQDDLIDLGFTYGGMGHIMKFSYIPSTQTYVFLPDGGSSGIERELHSKSSVKFKPDSKTVHHTFDELIDIFNDEDLDYFSLPSTPFE